MAGEITATGVPMSLHVKRFLLLKARADTCLYEEFVSEQEEQHIYDEVQPRLKRMRYETAHWDDVR